jgi:exopolysaccharide biosynthesis protein
VSFWFDAAKQPHLGPPDGKAIRHGVADWGSLLVTGGKAVIKPDKVLHPRPLAGCDAGGRWLVMVVVDGRRPGISEGMSLSEAATLMLAQGCTEAINLDGGGSSILLQRETAKPVLSVINQPSDGRPRPIPVMLGVRLKGGKPD